MIVELNSKFALIFNHFCLVAFSPIVSNVLFMYDGYDSAVELRAKTNIQDMPISHVILDKSSFYSEGGGQNCDTGILSNDVSIYSISVYLRIFEKSPIIIDGC